ncbi:V-type ATP synthase subunit I [Clostridia bacterium]|nr:V-type ATP synthase subunit I [Clostridia bacterium]
MAIIPMKLVTLVGPLTEFDDVTLNCVINRDFHPEPASQVAKNIKHLHSFELNNPYAELLRLVTATADHMGVELDYNRYSDFDKSNDALEDYLSELDRRFVSLINERERMERVRAEGAAILEQLTHIQGVNVDISAFFKLKYVKFRFGYMPRDSFEHLKPLIEDRDDLFFVETSIGKDTVHGMYFTTLSAVKSVDALFASVQFIRSRLSDRVRGDSAQATRYIEQESATARVRISAIDAELKKLRDEERLRVLGSYSYIRLRNDAYNIRRFAAHTAESFYVLGWVPEDSYQAFTDNISENHHNVVFVKDEPEAISDYKPPVKLKNGWLPKVFEPFIQMYGLPGYGEIDPTPWMAITYVLLFGAMFGDLGQGFVLCVGGFIVWKLKGIWLARCAGYMGISSMLFGLIYGSVFGNEHVLKVLYEKTLGIEPFNVVEGDNSHAVLQHSIAVGVVFILAVMVFNIINGIRQKNFQKSLFGASGLAGMIVYAVIVTLFLPIAGFWFIGTDNSSSGVSTTVLLLIAVLPFIAIFLREPLAKLAAKRKDWKPHNAGEFIVENIFEMIEVVLSYITNTLSFLRVGAYAISHASMMLVVYQLAGAVDGEGGNILGLILGNVVIMCLEALLAGIQVLRLEFYEMFSRFYEGDGHPYTPATVDFKRRAD